MLEGHCRQNRRRGRSGDPAGGAVRLRQVTVGHPVRVAHPAAGRLLPQRRRPGAAAVRHRRGAIGTTPGRGTPIGHSTRSARCAAPARSPCRSTTSPARAWPASRIPAPPAGATPLRSSPRASSPPSWVGAGRPGSSKGGWSSPSCCPGRSRLGHHAPPVPPGPGRQHRKPVGRAAASRGWHLARAGAGHRPARCRPGAACCRTSAPRSSGYLRSGLDRGGADRRA